MADNTRTQELLFNFVEKAATQKVRLQRTIQDYEEVQNTLTEAIIDQTDLIHNQGDPTGFLTKRKEVDEELKNMVENHLNNTKEQIETLSDEIQNHLVIYSDNEIENSGFVAHIIIPDYHTDYNPESKIITFKKHGRVEAPIATSLTSWKDTSELTILLTDAEEE